MTDYTYLGFNRIVQNSYTTQTGVELSYIAQPGDSIGAAGDQFIGLDLFGRVVDQRWLPIPGGSSSTAAGAVERVDYRDDLDSNPQWRQNLAAGTGQDEYYTYDGLQQLLTLQRGTLNAGKTGITGTPVYVGNDAINIPMAKQQERMGMFRPTKILGTTTEQATLRRPMEDRVEDPS